MVLCMSEPRSGAMRLPPDSCRSFAAHSTRTLEFLGFAPQAIACHRYAVRLDVAPHLRFGPRSRQLKPAILLLRFGEQILEPFAVAEISKGLAIIPFSFEVDEDG